MTTAWCEHPIHRLATAIETREVWVREVVDATLDRIADRDASLRAFTAVLSDRARVDADRADQEIAAGRYRGPLHGVPVSIKDLIDLAGVPTTAASRVTGRVPATSDAPVVARLRAAGRASRTRAQPRPARPPSRRPDPRRGRRHRGAGLPVPHRGRDRPLRAGSSRCEA